MAVYCIDVEVNTTFFVEADSEEESIRMLPNFGVVEVLRDCDYNISNVELITEKIYIDPSGNVVEDYIDASGNIVSH